MIQNQIVFSPAMFSKALILLGLTTGTNIAYILLQNKKHKVMDVEKLTSVEKAVGSINDGSVLMIGGFLGIGSPQTLIDGLAARRVKDLTIICNDADFIGRGIGILVSGDQVAEVIASHIGTNPEISRKINSGRLVVRLIPQGTLAEKIRAGGAGLGGVLTPTGVGTVVEEDKQKIVVDGKIYLLETAIRADAALIKAARADSFGNLVFRRAGRNFNPVMATAADYVVAEVEEYVQVGEIDPDEVMLPGIFVDAVVKGTG